MGDARLRRWALGSALLGGGLWLGLWLAARAGRLPLGDLALVLLLAALALSPLSLGLLLLPREGGPRGRLAAALLLAQPAAALGVLVSFLRPAGDIAALWALPWLTLCAGAALLGAWRGAAAGRGLGMAALAGHAALVYLAVGGIWLLFARWGRPLLGYQEPWVSLTAVHFHVLPLAALTIAALTGARLAAVSPAPGRTFPVLAGMLVTAPAVVALGFLTAVWVEALGAILLATGLAGIGLLGLLRGLRGLRPPAARLAIGASYAVAFLTMLLAVLYPLGRLGGGMWLTIDAMIRFHGWLNALVFGWLGLAGWWAARGAIQGTALDRRGS